MTLKDFGEICGDEIPSFLIFDFSTAPALLFYSYVPIAIVSIILAIFLMRKDGYSIRSKSLFVMAFFFALWMINILIQWVASYHTALLFGWQLTAIFEIGLYISALYFYIVFITKKDLSGISKWLMSIPLIATIVLTPTTLNITSYDVYWCEGDLGLLWSVIYYILEPLTIVLIPIIYFYRKLFLRTKLTSGDLYISIGLFLFLTIFYLSNVFGELTQTYETNLIGPLGLVFFQIFLVYSLVNFKVFKTKVLATEAFVSTLVVLFGAIFFVRTVESVKVISAITFVATIILGFLLTKSVREGAKQREKIEHLAARLGKANTRLKALDKQKSEFVSIASHQLRSPITAIRGYASLLLEDSYGKIPRKAVEPLTRIEESSKLMAIAIEDYLNVSRIESGNMKYNYTDLNLRNEVAHVCDDLREEAKQKGLPLIFSDNLKSRGVIHADIGKTVQIIQNLITNAIKYTPKGTIRVLVRDDVTHKRIYVDITDTGIGMNEETMQTIFQKFERAENANSVNVHGTGLGLYVAFKMAEEMKGTITAHSEGDGKGSRFTLDMPLAM